MLRSVLRVLHLHAVPFSHDLIKNTTEAEVCCNVLPASISQEERGCIQLTRVPAEQLMN